MSDLVKVNADDRLYVLSEGRGYSCLGFDVALRWASGVASWAGVPAPDPSKAGTAEGYADYQRCMAAGDEKSRTTGSRCPALLTPELTGREGSRVEVVDEYGERRRFWVGKSTGWLPIHLEVLRRNSSGGGGVTGAPFKSVRVVNSGPR